MTVLILLVSLFPASANEEALEDLIKKGKHLVSAMEFEEALICWDKALEIDGENIEVWHSRGLTFYYMEDYEEAVKCYNKVIELCPDHSYAWCDKGRALHNLGRYEEAIKCYDKTLELDPEDLYAEKFKKEAVKAMKK